MYCLENEKLGLCETDPKREIYKFALMLAKVDRNFAFKQEHRKDNDGLQKCITWIDFLYHGSRWSAVHGFHYAEDDVNDDGLITMYDMTYEDIPPRLGYTAETAFNLVFKE